jgi:hypothetical protein
LKSEESVRLKLFVTLLLSFSAVTVMNFVPGFDQVNTAVEVIALRVTVSGICSSACQVKVMGSVAFAGVTTAVNDCGLSIKPDAARVMVTSAMSTLVATANTSGFALTGATRATLAADGWRAETDAGAVACMLSTVVAARAIDST